ncbi:hypothetical protein QBC39DRAFT_158245 [Podospora conica]|nr:hypothetical protein QBC39DRAFT_158245 [Schizothecium conicum]
MAGHWNPDDYNSYTLPHEYAIPVSGGIAEIFMQRSDSNGSYGSQPSSGHVSWQGSTDFPSANFDDYVIPSQSPPDPDLDYDYFPEAQGSSFAQPLDYAGTSAGQYFDVEAAARQATDNATYHLNHYHGLDASFITSDAIDATIEQRLSHAEFPTREAIQTLLSHFLYGDPDSTSLPDMDTLLFEAAYQLQVRTEGPPEEVAEICHKALVVTLMQAEGSDLLPSPQAESSAQAESSTKRRTHKKTPKPRTEKKRHICRLAECEEDPKPFSRAADLERHQNQVHHGGKHKFPCDYRRCPRHRDPFSRQDHYRDHLRTFHYEDLPLRGGGKMDEEWWAGRSRKAVAGGWWRCNRCLVVRVPIETDGFACPGCGSNCEDERIEYRRQLAGSEEAEESG